MAAWYNVVMGLVTNKQMDPVNSQARLHSLLDC